MTSYYTPGETDNRFCTNNWCGMELSPFYRRGGRPTCSLCEAEIIKFNQAAKIANELGEDNERRFQWNSPYLMQCAKGIL